MGGLDSPTTWEWLPTGSDEWKRGNGIIPGGYGKYRGFYQGCGVKINDEEIALIGGVLTPRRLMKFNIKTEEFTSLGNVLKIKRENHACTVLSKLDEKFIICFTVWEFHDFHIIQILREINFGESRSAKSAILTRLEVLNFDI